MRGKYREIDPTQGLHEFANSFQLMYAERKASDILDNLDSLVKNTINKAPIRTKDFCLDRKTNPPFTHEEDKWERAMYEKWGPEGLSEFVSVCKRIQAYQYPLRDSRKDKRWGNIDLLGIGTDFLPVPIELTKREAAESPLRMLVEVAAYGFAIRKVWPNLKDEWVKAVRWSGASLSQFPATLDDVKVTLVGVAPEEYWLQCLGKKKGRFPCEAWPPFWKLVDGLGGKGFDIHFVAIKGSCGKTTKLATITGARVLDLRALTLNPTAGTPDSGL